MTLIDFINKGMATAANFPLDTQWRFTVMVLAVFCLLGLLALLPELPELPCITRLARTLVPMVKVMWLLAGRRRDWRGVLLDAFV
jgi:hypothetical protein